MRHASIECEHRGGGRDAFAALAERYRGWLLVLARLEVGRVLQAKTDPDDLVQETLLQAYRDRDQFRGHREVDFAAWLRGILSHVIAHEVRRYLGTGKRDIELERAIACHLEQSSIALAVGLVADDPSPSSRASRSEEGLLIARALASLPDDYREVIVLRSLEGRSYAEVAERLGRSEGAVRMLWMRALAALKDEVTR